VYDTTTTIASVDPTATEYVVEDASPVDVGWTCLVTNGVPAFTAPPYAYPTLTPMQFYLAFSPAERIQLKRLATTGIPASELTAAIPQDAEIAELWATYELAVTTQSSINPNLKSLQEGLAYLAEPTAPTPAVIASTRIPQILAGIAQ